MFRTHYALSDSPTVEEIINDEVLFYAHVPIKVGIELKAWYKLGKCKIMPGKEELDKVLFAYCSASFSDGESIDFEDQDPIDNWLVWKINKPMRHLHLNQLTQAYRDAIFEGSLEAYCDVINCMKYGYYWYTNIMFDVIKRRPLPDVYSYCRREVDGVTIYYHFHGADLVREMFVDGETVYRLSEQEPISPRYSLDAIKFWDINWRYR
ncbi:MAG: hypothetical protein K2M65_04940, partial [Muribaculaceae bacterium]|nr:hypothetical protein [Muribaculaceae bacterium]